MRMSVPAETFSSRTCWSQSLEGIEMEGRRPQFRRGPKLRWVVCVSLLCLEYSRFSPVFRIAIVKGFTWPRISQQA